ncbi:sigma-70 family RNA polymerase sigma factor [Chitinimonas sp.]|uniref:sigma-70 family RNA polymerase sigma factor n=1 Tax=Chitinimonas sp. TaxID=1934313 RepID=UPI0035AF5B3D
MANQDDIAQLLARTGLRDAAAFEALYHATSPRLYAVALRMLKRADWAEDVLQECYVNIWNHAADYAREYSEPFTWLTQIVRNRCLDWLRRPAREDSVGEDDAGVLENWQDERAGPLQQLLAADDARLLGRCLQALESRSRELITLAYFQGLSHSELAAQLALPLGSVKSWVRRGLMQLKECFAL